MAKLTIREAVTKYPQLTAAGLAKHALRGNIPFEKKYDRFFFLERDLQDLVERLRARKLKNQINVDNIIDWASKLSIEEIRISTEEKVIKMALESPDYSGRYNFVVSLQYLQKKRLYTDELHELILRLSQIKNLKDKIRKIISKLTILSVMFEDIVGQDVDAIVNSAFTDLRGGLGVDGAIHAAAGPELLKECEKLGGCETGDAKITKGYKLPAKYVIHTVGPVYMGLPKDAELLAKCYQRCLDVAMENQVKTIAFPSISTGAFGYPIEKAAPIAIRAVREWVVAHFGALKEVRFVLFSQEDYDLYKTLLG
jgi:O-acetyl-ADP-ribose deacetylase (regulator of RNase III)